MQRIFGIFFKRPTNVAVACFFIFFVMISMPLVYIYQKHKSFEYENFKKNLEIMASTLSLSIDDSLYKFIQKEQNVSNLLIQKTARNLLEFSSFYKNIHNVYVIIKKYDKKYYVLDVLNLKKLVASDKTIHFDNTIKEVIQTQKYDNCFEALKSGKVYVSENFKIDNNQTFISAIAPIYDENQTFIAALGVDVSLEKYKEIFKKTDNTFILSLIMAAIISCLASFAVVVIINYAKIFYYNLQKVSNSDRLTGVYNRFMFIEIFTREINRIQRNGDNLYLIFLDIDNFKHINDKYGHSIGDDIIIFTANQITKSIRKTDIVSRYGGDEFLISITGSSDNFIKDVIDRIMHQQYDFIYAVNKNGLEEKVVVNFSIGYTKYKDGDTFETMLKRADRGLYISKDFGKHRSTFVEK